MVLALAGQLFPKICLLSSFTKKKGTRKGRGQRVWSKSGMKLVMLRQIMLCGLRSVFRAWTRLGIFFPCFEKVQLWSTLWKQRSVWILSGAVPQFVLALDLKASSSKKLWVMLSSETPAGCRYFWTSLVRVLFHLHSGSASFSCEDSSIGHYVVFHEIASVVSTLSWRWHHQGIVFQYTIYSENLMVIWNVSLLFTMDNHSWKLAESFIMMRWGGGHLREAASWVFSRVGFRHMWYISSVHF